MFSIFSRVHLFDGSIPLEVGTIHNTALAELSRAGRKLLFTTSFSALATSIGTVEPTTTSLRTWIRQCLTAYYTLPLPIAAITFGKMSFPLRLLRLVDMIVRTGDSSSDSGSSYHRSACVSRYTTNRQSSTVISPNASLRRELALSKASRSALAYTWSQLVCFSGSAVAACQSASAA